MLRFAGSTEDSAAIGKALGVDAILEGHVQRSDRKLRLTAQLVRTADGAALWSGTFDDYFTNIFAVQDSISEQMTAVLSLRLTAGEKERLTRRETENTEAYQLYLMGN